LKLKRLNLSLRRCLSAGSFLALIGLFVCGTLGAVGQNTTTASNVTDGKTRLKATSKAQPKASTKSSAARTKASSRTKASGAVRSSSTERGKSKNVSSSHSASKRGNSRKGSNRKATARGQHNIDSQRAQAIQEALIREHYLSGGAAGTWNQASEDAMRKYQADHGWQSKTVPDSRALISLGLGPSHDHLLNPDSAMTTEPTEPHAVSMDPASHSADPGARLSAEPASVASPGAASTSLQDTSHPQ